MDDIMAIERARAGDSCLYLSSKDRPEVKKWMSGQKYEVNLKVKQLSSDVMEDGSIRAKFEVL